MGKKILIVDAGCTNYGKGGTLALARLCGTCQGNA